MTFGTVSDGGGSQNRSGSSGENKAALEGMLRGYPVEQLIEEVMTAWDEISNRNEEIVTLKQRMRIVELDLAEREDAVAPEVARLHETESQLQDTEARLVHVERLLDDAKDELLAQQSSISEEERAALEEEGSQLRELTIEQDEVIAELEGKVSQMIEALERAADAGLTSVTADEVRMMKSQLDQNTVDLEAEKAANNALEEERGRLRDIADRLRGLLDQRERRLTELEEQIERVMQGPRSVSAEHDYLVEQIEDLKRRLLERNREYESLRRRERRLHNDVFERDERLQQMSLTMSDLEGALGDRTAELREIEAQRERISAELEVMRRGERTREVVGKVFNDSLSLVRSHDTRESKREDVANSPGVERKIAAPDADDMKELAKGGTIDLEITTEELVPGPEVESRPPAPGGSGDPVVFEDED